MGKPPSCRTAYEGLSPEYLGSWDWRQTAWHSVLGRFQGIKLGKRETKNEKKKSPFDSDINPILRSLVKTLMLKSPMESHKEETIRNKIRREICR